MKFLKISYLFVSLVKDLFHVRPLKSLICRKHHNVIEKIVYLVFQLVIVTVFSSDNCFCSLFAHLFADLVYALVKKISCVAVLLSLVTRFSEGRNFGRHIFIPLALTLDINCAAPP